MGETLTFNNLQRNQIFHLTFFPRLTDNSKYELRYDTNYKLLPTAGNLLNPFLCRSDFNQVEGSLFYRKDEKMDSLLYLLIWLNVAMATISAAKKKYWCVVLNSLTAIILAIQIFGKTLT